MNHLDSIERLAIRVARWGIVGLLLWIGTFKFSPAEAEAIRPLVANHPLMAWMYALLSQQAVSNIIGLTEITVGVAIATRPWMPRTSFFGSLGAAGIFLVTLSFFVTTPGTLALVPGYPLPVPAGLGFMLIKDLLFFTGSLSIAVEAGRAAGREQVKPEVPLTQAEVKAA